MRILFVSNIIKIFLILIYIYIFKSILRIIFYLFIIIWNMHGVYINIDDKKKTFKMENMHIIKYYIV